MKPQTEALLDKARRSVQAAKILLRESSPEFAASRAYYAFLYIAEALLFEEDRVFKSHSAVHAAFGELFAKTGRLEPRFHRMILDAFRARQEGDYVARPEISGEAAEELIAGAEEFLASAVQYLLPTS